MKLENSNTEHIICKRALNKLNKRNLPYNFDLNIYRGCEHACKYCYAIYSHKYLNQTDFNKVFAKTNIAEVLDKELSKKNWKQDVVNIGGVTDSYQKTELQLKLMPDILRILIKHKTPAIISTKSDLILRDFELIDELSRITYVNVASTITTMDENIQQHIEAGASNSMARFKMLKEFRKTNASVALHTMPIIPFLTDSYENIEALIQQAQASSVHYMLPGLLYLRGETKKAFTYFLKQTYPNIYEKLMELYKNKPTYTAYKTNLYKNTVNPLLKKYGISTNYTKIIKEKMPRTPANNGQLTLDL